VIIKQKLVFDQQRADTRTRSESFFFGELIPESILVFGCFDVTELERILTFSPI
jgi:hypothetical protein